MSVTMKRVSGSNLDTVVRGKPPPYPNNYGVDNAELLPFWCR